MSELPENSNDVYNADELGPYQAISLMSVLALLLGLISSSATFLSPMLLVVPLLAVAVALLALAKINAPNSGLSGARLARAGLALAILFGVASCARLAVSNLLENRQAEDIAPVSQPLNSRS